MVGGVGALLVHAVRTAVDLGATTLDPRGFGAFGSPVATAQQALQERHVDALEGLLDGLQRVNGDIRRVADAYEQLDGSVAAGFRATGSSGDDGVHEGSVGTGVVAPAPGDVAAGHPAGGLLAGLWGSGVGSAVADHARLHVGDGEPSSVVNVVGYLRDGGVGRVGSDPLPSGSFDGPTSFADWLDSDPHHQTQVGVIHVYRGDVRDLADIPGGVRAGDVVVVEPDVIGVATTSAAAGGVQLVNHGPLDPDLGHRAAVRVYRPL
ncbi:WXG100 family type VII secretion target [Jatrophihabitans sp. YIM 134969]